jgi:hypothetical protein
MTSPVRAEVSPVGEAPDAEPPPGVATFWPTPLQTELLHAALDPDDSAVAAWRSWRDQDAFDRMDPGSFQILPLLYVNLRRLGVDDPELATLKGVYRQSWYLNQILLHRAVPMLGALQQAGIRTLVLKGGALGPLHYADLGARSMGDLDVVVPYGRAREAIVEFQRHGWVTPHAEAPAELVGTRPSVSFEDPGARCIELHWHATWHTAADEAFWSGAVPLTLAGAETLTLNPADQILHACVHGLSHGPQRMTHLLWIADALTVIRSAGSTVDWARIETQARAWRLTVALTTMLTYLRDELDAAVPEDFLRRLSATPSSWFERAAFQAATSPPGSRQTLLLLLDRYVRTSSQPVGWRTAIGFPGFLSRLFGYDHPWELPLHVLRRAAQRGVELVRPPAQA